MFNLPLIPHYLSGYLLNSSDKIMISNMSGNSETAYYSVAYALAAVVLMVWNSANASLIPFTYEKLRENKTNDIRVVTQAIVVTFATACFVLILVAPEIFKILTTEEYRIAVYVIPPIVGGVFFQAQYDLFANIVYYYKKPRYLMYGNVISCLINIGLNYLFIPRYGFIAAGYTTLFSYLLQAMFDYFAMEKLIKGRPIYDRKFLCGIAIVMLVLCAFSNFMYDSVMIRYFVLSIVFAVASIKHKRIINSFLFLRKIHY